jgi:putative DNA methylase
MTPPRKKLIEVALPLEAINVASAREKTIRRGQPANLHLWWARRPITASRAVIFTSLVDDPDNPNALPEFVEACQALPKGKYAQVEDTLLSPGGQAVVEESGYVALIAP